MYLLNIKFYVKNIEFKILIWFDNSRNDGYWRNDRANVPGRLIHADGDVYQEDWVGDKAQGCIEMRKVI